MHTNPDMLETAVHLYKGWEVHILENRWLKLCVLPALGGRLMQIELDGHEFLFVNKKLEGTMPNDDGLGENGSWLNFGGEKIWPAPQGWGATDLWPGPPDPVLDSGAYTVNEKSDNTPAALDLTSLYDDHTGLQIDKKIILAPNRSEITVQVTFNNRSETIREWSIWPVIQLNTPEDFMGGRYFVTCPVNPISDFLDGYKVMHGLVNNPQNGIDDQGNFLVEYQYLTGKVGLDTNANWVAFCDIKKGKVFVTTFEHQQDANYPEGTSVQIWTQGRGMIYSRNRVLEYSNDPEQNPPYLEVELLSPLYKMLPGEQAHFEYKMSMCSIPALQQIHAVHEYGVVAVPLRAALSKEGALTVVGSFGVFCHGIARLVFRDGAGEEIYISSQTFSWRADPLVGLSVALETTVSIPAEDVWASLEWYDQQENFIGALYKTKICKN
ncbi:uncharacterized protein DUF4380 [Dyadobacter jejuensis]|uniref:Uncharacterized protein DUF4380 n=1 Tax=Dyadobacter jejuensis TaxID=1082580 RepID=A0A316AB33_9BACT|nr:DUF4380 domain-containing protein [Dyadobacter jejuensis]PWJ54064.1 uncharacterized protein DUF4380 [Dyadobacter jejuensis]